MMEKMRMLKELAENIKDAISRGDIDVEVLGDKVVVNFTPTEADEKNYQIFFRKH